MHPAGATSRARAAARQRILRAFMFNVLQEVPGTSGGESLWEDVIYDLTVTNEADGSAVRYRGRADIYFRLEGNFWYVYRWIDNGGESPPEGGASLQTMGVIRGTFASNR